MTIAPLTVQRLVVYVVIAFMVLFAVAVSLRHLVLGRHYVKEGGLLNAVTGWLTILMGVAFLGFFVYAAASAVWK